MNAERQLVQYERISDAPDAIPRLRRFILDLAVRGKLVEQDPSDGNAASLLAEVKQTWTARMSSQSVKKKKVWELSQFSDVPFEVPENWALVKLGQAVELVNGRAFKPSDWTPTGLPIIRIQNLNNPLAPFNRYDGEVKDKFLIDTGDFLISWSGTPGTSFGAHIWDRGPAVLNQHIFKSTPTGNAFEPLFLKLAINARLFELIQQAHGGVGLQHITKPKLEAVVLTLPPLGEQHRIVTKVDELMALCERLEATRMERETTRNRLTAATLARLNVPGSDPVTLRNHATFALENLTPLTTRPDQISTLRQTILGLATRGKLVPQNSMDEPAQKLLERIVESKGRPRRTINRISEPYGLPASWTWAALDELITAGPQNGISPKPTTQTDAPKAITLTATTSGTFKPDNFKHVEANVSDDSELWLRDGDLLFQRGNTREYVGIAAIYEGPPQTFLFPDLIMRVRVSPLANLRFIHLAAISPSARAYFSQNASGAQETMPKVNQTTLVSLPIPLPPLAEQHRIVAKVDELMTLCDRLEDSLSTGCDTRLRLLDAVLNDALAPSAEPKAAA